MVHVEVSSIGDHVLHGTLLWKMKSNDPVTTTIMIGDRLCAVHARVQITFELAQRPGFRWECGTAFMGADAAVVLRGDPHDCFFNDIGITWLHGWQRGEAVDALLASAALDVGAVPAHEIDDYSSAGYDWDDWHYDRYLDDDHPIYKDVRR